MAKQLSEPPKSPPATDTGARDATLKATGVQPRRWRLGLSLPIGPSKDPGSGLDPNSCWFGAVVRDPAHLAHCQRRWSIRAPRDAPLRRPHQSVDPRGLSVGSRARLRLILPPLGIAGSVLAEQLVKAPGRMDFQHVVFVERALAHDGPARVGVILDRLENSARFLAGKRARVRGLNGQLWKIGPGTSSPANAPGGGFEDERPGKWLSVALGVPNLREPLSLNAGVGGDFDIS